MNSDWENNRKNHLLCSFKREDTFFGFRNNKKHRKLLSLPLFLFLYFFPHILLFCKGKKFFFFPLLFGVVALFSIFVDCNCCDYSWFLQFDSSNEIPFCWIHQNTCPCYFDICWLVRGCSGVSKFLNLNRVISLSPQ